VSYSARNETAASRLYHQLKSMLGHLGMHPDHLIPRHAYLKTDIPVAGVAHQAGTCRMGTDPAWSSSSPQSIRATSVRSRTCGPRLLEKCRP
jgi:choline dehydrogenase-like flavoprotein